MVGFREGVLAVRVTAPPAEGQANRAVVAVLAKALGVRQGDIHIVTGQTSRQKLVDVAGLNDDEVRQRLYTA